MELIPFTYTHNSVRLIEDEGQILFCGKDVASILGYKDATDALKRHCRGVVKHYPIVDSLGRSQSARFITEPDLYRLITRSKLPEAEKFERWVFEEVLPSIRARGGYLIRQKGSSWNMPTQKAMDMGLFRVKESIVTHADGHTTVNRTTKVTGRGQTYFVNKLLAHKAGN